MELRICPSLHLDGAMFSFFEVKRHGCGILEADLKKQCTFKQFWLYDKNTVNHS